MGSTTDRFQSSSRKDVRERQRGRAMRSRAMSDGGLMGLFGNKEPHELSQLLDAMQGSTLRDIDAVRAGTPLSDLEAKGGVFAEMTLNNRIARAANLVRKMRAKGKQTEAEAILAEFEAKP